MLGLARADCLIGGSPLDETDDEETEADNVVLHDESPQTHTRLHRLLVATLELIWRMPAFHVCVSAEKV